MPPTLPHDDNLASLLSLFHSSEETVGGFSSVNISTLPSRFAELLAHDNHMTVTVEKFHDCLVAVRVLDRRVTSTHYARKIVLSRQSDGQVVQFGIMRVRLDVLDKQVREEIESEAVPLGRILINHNVFRCVRLLSLWQVKLGEELASQFQAPPKSITYGRTAAIDCHGETAVELLEIVAPLGSER